MISPTIKAKPVKIQLVTTNNLEIFDRKELFESLKFNAKYKQIAFLAESYQVFVGATFEVNSKTFDPFHKIDFFNLGAVLVNQLSKTSHFELDFVDSELKLDARSLQDFLLGMHQASWNFDTYLDTKKAKTRKLEITLNPEYQKLLGDEKLAEINILNSNLNLVRNLVESTPEDVNPQSILKVIQENLGNKPNLNLEIWDAQKLTENNFNSVMSVGRASRYQPTLVQATLKPSGTINRKICLVGKGITYDSGGLDIKTEGHMKTMKSDMAGAATMFGVIKALCEIGLKHTQITWISAFAENMVAGNSYKSDDIITSYSGQTIEIFNTDAEGRLLLADCLALATTLDPDYIIDAATLTGACIMSISQRYTAMMSNDKNFSDDLYAHFISQNEHAVQVILPEDLRSAVEGKISDLINTSSLGRQAGHITAGLFLSHFVNQNLFRNPELKIEKPKEYSWIHLDIAGSAMNIQKNNLECDGATGQSLRSLVSWVKAGDL